MKYEELAVAKLDFIAEQEDTAGGYGFVDSEYEDVKADFSSESEIDLKLQMMLEKPCEEQGRTVRQR